MRRPHVALVYPVVQVDDGYGGTKPGEGTPVSVRCLIQPATSSSVTEGYASDDLYRMTAPTLPASPWSRVDWNGETWQVVGQVKQYSASRRTSYAEALIRRR